MQQDLAGAGGRAVRRRQGGHSRGPSARARCNPSVDVTREQVSHPGGLEQGASSRFLFQTPGRRSADLSAVGWVAPSSLTSGPELEARGGRRVGVRVPGRGSLLSRLIQSAHSRALCLLTLNPSESKFTSSCAAQGHSVRPRGGPPRNVGQNLGWETGCWHGCSFSAGFLVSGRAQGHMAGGWPPGPPTQRALR